MAGCRIKKQNFTDFQQISKTYTPNILVKSGVVLQIFYEFLELYSKYFRNIWSTDKDF